MKKPCSIVQTARETFQKGRTRCLKFRESQLKKFRKFLVENEEMIVQTIGQDLRKPREEIRTEIFIGINHLDYLLRNFKKWARPEKMPKRMVDWFDGLYVYKDPYGVVLVMGTWNVPVLTLLPAAGAISAGNAVVIKPSHHSPAFGELLIKTLPTYLDPECYPVILGDIPETNTLLQEKFDYIYFTGSRTAGQIVHSAANKNLTPVTLELGGKNPVYIDASADLECTTARILWGKLTTSGQACIAPDYLLCTKEIQKEFVEHSKKVMKKFGVKSCSIVNDSHFKRLTTLMDGLTIALGGNVDAMENLMELTIAVDVDPNHRIMQEEIFGPILPVVTVKNVDEAVDFINCRPKPLALYVFSKNRRVTDFVLANTSSGGVTVNDTLMHLMAESLPFGGVGCSGMGKYKGKDSFDTFVHKKGVLVKNFWWILELIQSMRYPPYSRRKTDFLALLLKSRPGLPFLGFLGYVLVFVFGIVVGYLGIWVLLGIIMAVFE